MMDKQTKKKLTLTILITFITLSIFVILYFSLGLNNYFTDAEVLRETIEGYGDFGKFIYVLINLLQTTIIPITNIPTIFAGTYIYGPLEAANLAIIGVLIGSVISFYLGRLFGTKLVLWIIGKERLDKYLKMMNGRENVVFFLTMLLPGFPDDIICMIAGITPMKFKFFSITLLITRTIPIYLTAYGASLIPLNNIWGWIIWIVIYVVIFYVGQKILRNWDAILTRLNKKNDAE